MLECYDIEISNSDALSMDANGDNLLYDTGDITGDIKQIIKREAESGKEIAIINHDDILKDWFPKTGCHIFMSHSHKDEKTAIKIANILYKRHGIKTFIDSKFWGYVDTAIREINHSHSKSDSNPGYLDYSRCMRVASNFYVVLVNALTDGIFNSDSCWFINTENSLNATNASGEGTYSPWIYTEMNYTSTVQRKPHPDRPMPFFESSITNDSVTGNNDLTKSHGRDVSVRFGAKIGHMKKVSSHTLISSIENNPRISKSRLFNKGSVFNNLDAIYERFERDL